MCISLSTVQLHSFNLVNGCCFSSSAVVKEVGGENAKTEDLGETKKKKKKRKKDLREEEEKPRNKEKHHRELQETNGDESPSPMGNTDMQKPSKLNAGINTLPAVRS